MASQNISLELFSGTAPFSRVAAEMGFTPYTLDINPRHNPDFCVDLMEWEPKIAPGSVAAFWASPDCVAFSRAANQHQWVKTNIGYRNYSYLPLSDKAKKSVDLVQRVVELIDYFKPKVWFIENPVGRIHHLQSIRQLGHYRYGVNYRDWGFDYSKETYIFTNQLLNLPQQKIIRTGKGLRTVNNKIARSVVPLDLIRYLLEHSQF